MGKYFSRPFHAPSGECHVPLKEVRVSHDEAATTISDDDCNSFVSNIKNNNISALHSLDTYKLQRLLSHVCAKYNKPILSEMCEDKHQEFRNVNERTLQLLIENGANNSPIDKNWYGWEPIHYAAQATNPATLQVIARNIRRGRINTLTFLSENALHVLLDHGKFVESYQVSCQNGVHMNMSKILRSEHDNIVQCVKILIDSDIDVNHNNFWNETPILIAIKRKYFKVIELLLKIPHIDLDSCVDKRSGKTARELLKEKEIFFSWKLLPKHTIVEDPAKILFQHLKSGDEESFLKANNGRIGSEYVNALDGNCPGNSSCTLLQYCFRRGLICCMRNLKKKMNFQYCKDDETVHGLIQDFWQYGMIRCIEHLLDNGADINAILRKFPDSLVQVASLKGYFPFVCLILAHKKAKFSHKIICQTLLKLTERNSLDASVADNTILILLHRLITSNKPLQNEDKNTLKKALAQSVNKINSDNMRLLLKLSGSLATKSRGKFVLEEIDPEIIQNHLDDCVEKQDEDICINYETLVTEEDENEAIKIFVAVPSLNIFLNNLVFKTLIKRKWENLRGFFYLNLGFYMFFYGILNLYVLLKFNKNPGLCLDLLLALGLLCLVVFTTKEFFQFLTNPRIYINEFNNYIEISFLIVTLLTYCVDEFLIEVFMVLSVLLSNFALLLLLEQVPGLAKYMIILRTMVFYLKYIIFYFLQFIAFGICFYILFFDPKQVMYKELPNKVFETIILFTGNLDFMETGDFGNYEIFAKFIFLLFVIFMSIILNNLLLGLLVTDLNEIKKDVKLNEQIRRARFIVRLEEFLGNAVMLNLFSSRKIFQNGAGDKRLILNLREKRKLDEFEKQHLDIILAKRAKTQDVLGKLYLHYFGLNDRRSESKTDKEITRELLDKLKLLEQRIKDLHDVKEIIKTEFSRNKFNNN